MSTMSVLSPRRWLSGFVFVLVALLVAGPGQGRPLSRSSAEGPARMQVTLRGDYGRPADSDFDHTWHASATIGHRLFGPLDFLVDLGYLRGAGYRRDVPPNQLWTWENSDCPDCGLYYDTPVGYALAAGMGVRLTSGQASARGPYLEVIPTAFGMHWNPSITHISKFRESISTFPYATDIHYGFGWQLRAGFLYRVSAATALDLGWEYLSTPDFARPSDGLIIFRETDREPNRPGPGFRQIGAYLGVVLGRTK